MPGVQADLFRPPPSGFAAARLRLAPGYHRQFDILVRAAHSAGIVDPADLAGNGVARLGLARGWSPHTVATFSRIARYAGIPTDRCPTPDPVVFSDAELEVLRIPGPSRHLVAFRNTAWAQLAWGWPASLRSFVALRDDELVIDRDDVWVRSADLTPRCVRGAGPTVGAWRAQRRRAGIGGVMFLVTVHPGRHPGSTPGDALSLRGAEASFSTHGARCGLHGLTFDRYRLAALAAGIAGVDRGVVAGLRKALNAPL